MIPLPDPDAPANSDSHPTNWPEYPVGSTVLALYPETTCLYRAEVVQGIKETRVRTEQLEPYIITDRRPQAAAGLRMYRLRFEDDDDQVHLVSAQWVVEWGGP